MDFQQAKSVFVWLGEEGESDGIAFKMMRFLNILKIYEGSESGQIR